MSPRGESKLVSTVENINSGEELATPAKNIFKVTTFSFFRSQPPVGEVLDPSRVRLYPSPVRLDPYPVENFNPQYKKI